MKVKSSFFQRHPVLKDGLGLVGFVVAVVIGTLILNNFVFRSYNVVGHSMDSTLYEGDRILVNRLPVTMAHLQRKEYVPKRGQIIVFANPNFTSGGRDRFIIKRVLAFEGERVTVKDGNITVFNDERPFPYGFNPDDELGIELGVSTSGEIDMIVPRNEVFVAGDNREGSNSHDSRNGLGTVPLYDIIGPAGVRFFPFDRIRGF